MKTSDRNRLGPLHFLSLLVVAGAMFLCSCADSAIRTTPPPPGMGVLDTTPDLPRRDRIDDLRIVAVNGRPAKGDEAELSPGRNRVRVRFSWPQGGQQELDLDFNVRPGKIYAVYCDVDPPLAHHAGALARGTGSMLEGADNDPFAPIGAGLAVAAIAPFLVAEASTMRVSDQSAPATRVDLMVVAQHSSEGIVCNRRVYPNGRIEKR
ncbi:hypothetical protein [Haloferula helveola]